MTNKTIFRVRPGELDIRHFYVEEKMPSGRWDLLLWTQASTRARAEAIYRVYSEEKVK